MTPEPIRRVTISDAHPGAGIRRLERDDLDQVVRLCNTAIRRGESTYGPADVCARDLSRWLLDAPARFESFVCENDTGALAGWGALVQHTGRPIYDTIAELEICVCDAQRRRGIGRALARHALARARQLGFRALLVMIPPEPTHVPAWAVRQGFESVGWLAGAVPVGTRFLDMLVFQKRLVPGEIP